jgi:hypothetical protein
MTELVLSDACLIPLPSGLQKEQRKDGRDNAIQILDNAISELKCGRAINIEEICQQLRNADQKERPRLSILTPQEILSMSFDPRDVILGDHLITKGQTTTILGPGGIGKSRLVLQMAASIITGRDFLKFSTNGAGTKWLFLQTENGASRLSVDVGNLFKAFPGSIESLGKSMRFFVRLKDSDYIHGLEDPETTLRLKASLEDNSPDVVVIDPLRDFAIGDLNSDADMSQTCHALQRLIFQANPKAAVVIIHHAITGKNGAAKAHGWDAASYGRNSKALQSLARAQINVAVGDPEDPTKLVIACGKNNDGERFRTFGVTLEPATMLYGVDMDFELEEWLAKINGTKSSNQKPKDLVPDIVELLSNQGPMKRGEVVKGLKAAGKISQSSNHGYDVIAKAVENGAVMVQGDLLTLPQCHAA